MKNKMIRNFRLIGFVEGISYLLLLGVAMPIKYVLGYPEAVKIIGMTHGILFILFVLVQTGASEEGKFTLRENALFFVASLIPLGTFFTDKKLKLLSERASA